ACTRTATPRRSSRRSPPPERVATFDDVRAEAASLPGAEESTSFGTPAVKVRKKLLCRLLPTPGEAGDILALRVDLGDKELLLRDDARVFFTAPHYDGYPMVLVRLREIDRPALRELLRASWRYVAPPSIQRLLAD
ncbi:MAG: MmcQ/YjbR family DNA-binding protein, partial [Candidatus Dormibacteraceae bacterium]